MGVLVSSGLDETLRHEDLTVYKALFNWLKSLYVCLCVCVCVWERERERERERESVCFYVWVCFGTCACFLGQWMKWEKKNHLKVKKMSPTHLLIPSSHGCTLLIRNCAGASHIVNVFLIQPTHRLRHTSDSHKHLTRHDIFIYMPTVSHRSEYTPHIFVNILYIFMWQHWRNYTLLQCKVVSVQLV